MLSVAPFMLQLQAWVIATEIVRPTKSKDLRSGPLQEKTANPWAK